MASDVTAILTDFKVVLNFFSLGANRSPFITSKGVFRNKQAKRASFFLTSVSVFSISIRGLSHNSGRGICRFQAIWCRLSVISPISPDALFTARLRSSMIFFTFRVRLFDGRKPPYSHTSLSHFT